MSKPLCRSCFEYVKKRFEQSMKEEDYCMGEAHVKEVLDRIQMDIKDE